MAMRTVLPGLERRLRSAVRGTVMTDAFSRGQYATDASAYQVMPAAVVVPESTEDVPAILDAAREEGVSVTPRGGGTSQCGQTVNDGIVVDTSKHLNRLLALDEKAGTCTVEPGIVLDDLNRLLKPHGLWFPVDISTASRATIGGMAGNNSCGGRSLRYGIMRDNVSAIEGVMADGTHRRFDGSGGNDDLRADMLALGERLAPDVAARFPKVQRRVGGYNLDALVPGTERNLAHLLVGSEGTLAFSTAIGLKLAPLMGATAMGVCHFGSFRAAMDAAQHLVTLGPVAIELVDRTMIGLGRRIAIYRDTLDDVVRGDPAAILIVEFAEDEAENARRLDRLVQTMGDLGFGWDRDGDRWGGVVTLPEKARQAALTEVRKGGLNIMMSMKEAGKPVSFVEDCAVPLEHLADYTDRLTELFARHGTTGTWYAHASVGCLHVRPILNLKRDADLARMRAIAEAAFAMVREYKGAHSGEHGDGIVRSEFHEQMFGPEIVRGFEAVKDRFDPAGRLNPGRIVRPPKMDDRRLLRYGPDYADAGVQPALDWSGWPGGFLGAAEMCNNNGACRKSASGVMCPSFRVTRDERDVTRGRANTLRLALSGQLGPDALASDEMAETLKLCVSCKACRRECPTGVDMARMKIEVMAARAGRGLGPRERLVAWLPRYAPRLARMAAVANAAARLPGGRAVLARAGIAPKRSLPVWHAPFAGQAAVGEGPEVAVFADTFDRYFEPDVLADAVAVLAASGFRVLLPTPADGGRPLCCGRTFLAAGLVDEARAEMRRTAAVLAPLAARGVPILGLEPSCLFTFRDELGAVLPGPEADAIAERAMLVDTFLAGAWSKSRPLVAASSTRVLFHGHCHQKSFGEAAATPDFLRRIDGVEVETVESGCCGMAGAFGYQAETYETSMAMAELALLPSVRSAPDDAIIAATGTSCRHQILDGAGRRAVHPVQVAARALAAG